MPDYVSYHRSVVAELQCIKNRIRDLVGHRATQGEWKESSLRAVLRRHLPPSVFVGRGFVVSEGEESTQIDVLVLGELSPVVFKDGDLAIVTADAATAIIEVKTSFTSESMADTVMALARKGEMCRRALGNASSKKQGPWLGLFVYDGRADISGILLEEIQRAFSETGSIINCVSVGTDLFVRFSEIGEIELGERQDCVRGACWRAYGLEGLAPSYFVGNIVDRICNVHGSGSQYAWFAIPGGKFSRLLGEMPLQTLISTREVSELVGRIRSRWKVDDPFSVLCQVMPPKQWVDRDRVVVEVANRYHRRRVTEPLRRDVLELIRLAESSGMVCSLGGQVMLVQQRR